MAFDPVSKVINAAASGIETVAGVFTSNKEKEAQRSADEQMALLKTYQAEFNQRDNRTWADSLADAFNRLVRPVIVTLVLFIFIIAYISPSHLAEITLAMSAIPNGYWTLLSVIVAFYFGGRMQLKSQQFKFQQSQVAAVKALIATRNEFRQLAMDDDEPDTAFGESLGKDPKIDQARTEQSNSLIETALSQTAMDDKEQLNNKIAELKSEPEDSIRQRQKSLRRGGVRRL